MRRHAPGPWHVERYAGMEGLSIIPGDGSPVVADRVWREADARLIAAAPDLLAALEDAHDALGELMGNPTIALDWHALSLFTGNVSWDDLKERIDAAIARAKGEESA